MLLNERVYCVVVTFKVTEQVEQWIGIKFCVKLEHSSAETMQVIERAFGYNAMSAAQISVARALQRWLRTCWKWSTFRKTCNKQNPWACWTCRGCNQRRSVTDRARTRCWCGDSKHYCVRNLDAGSWRETGCGKIHSVTSATRAEGTSCCSCSSNCYQWTRFPHQGHNWRSIVGLQLWLGNEGLVIPMEVCQVFNA